MCNEIEGSYDNIIIVTIVPSYTRKKHHSFVASGTVTRAAHSYNTDSNKLVVFSSIALYYSDTYINHRMDIRRTQSKQAQLQIGNGLARLYHSSTLLLLKSPDIHHLRLLSLI